MAVAKLEMLHGAGGTVSAAFDAEVKHLATLRHPNIVQLLGRVSGQLAFVTELCEGGLSSTRSTEALAAL